MKSLRFPALIAATAIVGIGATAARNAEPAAPHFTLIEPISWIVENQRGDPQKAGPCGGTNTDWGTESFVVNEAKGGAMQHLKFRETVFHPGHFRVALAVNSMGELPPDPVTTTQKDTLGRDMSVSAVIQNPAVPPILVDGLFPRTTRGPALETFDTDIMLPNINCDRCVLQIVQFMSAHAFNNPGGYTYHHCAIMHITADPSKPIDAAWPAQRKTD